MFPDEFLTRAHPRSRGENGISAATETTGPGSSPLTRGKRRLVRPGPRGQRLIPAHAGKTAPYGPATRRASAHPRSRGENMKGGRCVWRPTGSSPLTRGKLDSCMTVGISEGLIPAHAGKTHGSVMSCQASTAHPRSRGENSAARGDKIAGAGSSPLTRGKRLHRDPHRAWRGLIPAHAGKTPVLVGQHGGQAAHPRSRGENRDTGTGSLEDYGSSPLTRGKRSGRWVRSCTARLIPAHAGKTLPRHGVFTLGPAHPRSRGENYCLEAQFASDCGSSPLTRGKRTTPCCRGRTPGLIPAHAGKTAIIFPMVSAASAHPRSRGENLRTD